MAESDPSDRSRFRRNVVRVLTVQVIALTLLWLLQVTYTP